jgi:LCP family protein required for cell wall assembly
MSDQRRRVQPKVLLFLVTLGVLVSVLAGVFVWVQGHPGNRAAAPAIPAATSASPTATPSPKPTPSAPPVPVDKLRGRGVNILLLGSDTREPNAKAAAARVATDQRADAIIVVHITADRRHAYGISVMRDTWAAIPGHGFSKINDGLALGGVPLMTQTVESLFRVHIDHAVLIDFGRFTGLVDALGGVEVDVRTPFTSTHDSGHVFGPGKQTLTGAQALEFVRERYAFTDGDYQRVRDQQTFVKALIAKLLSPKTLTNPETLRKVVSSVSSFFAVNAGLDASAVAGLAYSLRNIRLQDGVFFALPTAGVGTSDDGRSIVLQDSAAITKIRAALAGDRVAQYIKDSGIQLAR